MKKKVTKAVFSRFLAFSLLALIFVGCKGNEKLTREILTNGEWNTDYYESKNGDIADALKNLQLYMNITFDECGGVEILRLGEKPVFGEYKIKRRGSIIVIMLDDDSKLTLHLDKLYNKQKFKVWCDEIESYIVLNKRIRK